jgi:hypothetical protein
MRLGMLIVFFSAATAAFAQSSDTMRLKLGFWLVKQYIGGLATAVEYEACVDHETNYVVQEEEGCTKPAVKREGAGFLVQSVCPAQGGGKAFQRIIVTGNFDSAYTERKTTTFRPPLQGMTTAAETVEWRWVAATCKKGMKPGDVDLIRK